MICVGTHMVKHRSTTQPTIALSSAEAELVGIVKGAAQGLGMHALTNDLGCSFKLAILSDATAAIGTCRKRWPGKVKHISITDL